jgi:hypothetical protein
MLLSLEIQALQALADRHDGRLTPEMVVEAARDPAHPLHERFTWDDAKAGHAHRLNEARHVIRNIRIEVRHNTALVKAPLFVRDPAVLSYEQGYVSIPRLMSDEERARAAVVAEFQRAAGCLQRAKAIAAALNLIGAIEGLETQLTHVQDLARSGDAAVRAGH